MVTEVQRNFLDTASPEDIRELAIAATNKLPTDEKKEVGKRTGLAQPTRLANDIIRILIIFGFVIVLLGAALTLEQGRFQVITPGQGSIYTTNDTILTLFTTASAFLIGLLAPSPLKGGGGQ